MQITDTLIDTELAGLFTAWEAERLLSDGAVTRNDLMQIVVELSVMLATVVRSWVADDGGPEGYELIEETRATFGRLADLRRQDLRNHGIGDPT